MNASPSRRRLARVPVLMLSAAALSYVAPSARAQFLFSIDYRGASIGTPATGGGCITEADILTPAGGGPAFGPMPAPMIAISGGFGPPGPGLGIPLGGIACACHPPGVVCGREVDALSLGNDALIKPVQMPAGTYVFSVDACTFGLGGPLAPNVATEGPINESAGDVFEGLNVPAAPIGPGLPAGNTGIVDGNGFPSASGGHYPGLGLVEPRLPGIALTGDDVDAVDINAGPIGAFGGVYFSLDAGFPNVCTGLPNTGSAIANGFMPGAVLVTPVPGGPPVVYAPPPLLGLDLMGPGTDDLDAIALGENGVGGYQPSQQPYGWFAGADMLLFSVRRGSAVVGMPDSIFGIPIEPGDILVPPVGGGLSPFPGIFVAAERLGLATGRGGAVVAAELDALDTVLPPQTGIPYCFGTTAACPCGNNGAPGNGCANSANALGANLNASGFASVAGDTVLLSGAGMPAGSPALYFQGNNQINAPFGDGIRCVAGAVVRLGIKINTAAGTSAYPVGADLPVSVKGLLPAAGGTRFYQTWYRDSVLFCTASTFNLTNGVGIVWTP